MPLSTQRARQTLADQRRLPAHRDHKLGDYGEYSAIDANALVEQNPTSAAAKALSSDGAWGPVANPATALGRSETARLFPGCEPSTNL